MPKVRTIDFDVYINASGSLVDGHRSKHEVYKRLGATFLTTRVVHGLDGSICLLPLNYLAQINN